MAPAQRPSIILLLLGLQWSPIRERYIIYITHNDWSVAE